MSGIDRDTGVRLRRPPSPSNGDRRAATELPPGPLSPATSPGIEEIIQQAAADACLQCHKCTAGCPVAEQMDLRPSQLVRLVQLGAAQELTTCRAIWLCTSCQTCTTRCPAGVDLARIHDMLRALCRRSQAPAGDRRAPVFHEAVLDTVARYGRLSELGMMRRFKLRTGAYFEDLRLGLALLRRGKLPLRASRTRDRAEIRHAIRAVRERREAPERAGG